MKKILVAYDDTEPSKRALERAAMIAEKFDSHVIITSIVSLLHSSPHIDAARDRSGSVPSQDVLVAAQHKIEERGISAESIEATGDPGSAIANLAAQQNVDLVVLGTRELGPVQRLFGHSVSEAVTRHVHCDVMIVHPEHTPAT